MVNKVDALVHKYRASSNEREKNKLFIEIASQYLPRVKNIQKQYGAEFSGEIMSIYFCFILRCIDKWQGRSSFTTYAYPYSGIKLKSEIQEKHIYKIRRAYSLTKEMLQWDIEQNQDSNYGGKIVLFTVREPMSYLFMKRPLRR